TRHGRSRHGQSVVPELGRPRPRTVVLDAGHGFQRTRGVAPRRNLRVRERHQRRSARERLRDQNESGFICDRERTEEHARGNAEGRRGRPDSKAEDGDDEPDVSRIAPGEPQGAPEALLQTSHHSGGLREITRFIVAWTNQGMLRPDPDAIRPDASYRWRESEEGHETDGSRRGRCRVAGRAGRVVQLGYRART